MLAALKGAILYQKKYVKNLSLQQNVAKKIQIFKNSSADKDDTDMVKASSASDPRVAT